MEGAETRKIEFNADGELPYRVSKLVDKIEKSNL